MLQRIRMPSFIAVLAPWIAIMTTLLVLSLVPSTSTKALTTKKEALEMAFPKGQVNKEILYFSEAERRQIEELAQVKMDSGLFTVYRGYRGNRPVGYAFIDTRIIRSKPATFLVVLSPGGKIRKSRILAWEEPPEYHPSERWLAQFEGHGLEPHVRLGGEIQAMSGASLSSQTLTNGIRRVLAIYQVKLARD